MKTHGVICSMPKEKFGYFGWPSIARQDDGTLVVAASGFRNQHVCPWGLHDHSHEGREDPEEAELVRIRTQRRENAADVGALERVGDLNSEETEAQVPHLPEC